MPGRWKWCKDMTGEYSITFPYFSSCERLKPTGPCRFHSRPGELQCGSGGEKPSKVQLKLFLQSLEKDEQNQKGAQNPQTGQGKNAAALCF